MLRSHAFHATYNIFGKARSRSFVPSKTLKTTRMGVASQKMGGPNFTAQPTPRYCCMKNARTSRYHRLPLVHFILEITLPPPIIKVGFCALAWPHRRGGLVVQPPCTVWCGWDGLLAPTGEKKLPGGWTWPRWRWMRVSGARATPLRASKAERRACGWRTIRKKGWKGGGRRDVCDGSVDGAWMPWERRGGAGQADLETNVPRGCHVDVT